MGHMKIFRNVRLNKSEANLPIHDPEELRFLARIYAEA
jgi:hypothetical protein